MNMDCIILAGGFGTRLQKVISHIPKPLAPIGNTPFLDYLLQQIEKWKIIDQVVFSIGYLGEKIQDFVKNSSYSFECLFSYEDSPLGTGGSLLKAMQKTSSPQVIVMNGDSYFDLCIQTLTSSHQKTCADMTIACLQIENASRYGSIQITNEKRIIKFAEKTSNGSSLINGGIYCVNRDLCLSLPFQGKCSLELDIFPYLLKYNLYACPFHAKFIDIGTEHSYKTAQTLLGNL